GIGAYAAVVLFKWLQAPLAAQIVGAALAAGLLGFGVGLMTLRLRGIFFAIATVAVVFIMETMMVNWRYVGGATGLQILRPPVELSFIEPASTFNLSYTIGSLGSAIIGGMSHWAGPIIGAILLGTLQQVITVTISGEVNVLVVGVLLVFFVVVAPEGILGLLKKIFGK